jgi:GntR family transcriptional regulator
MLEQVGILRIENLVMDADKQAKPLYKFVEESILQQIEAEELNVNDRLPSEHELSQIYSVGRNTVRRAISELANMGVLKTIPGVGTFVSDQRLDKTAQYLFGFTNEMQLHGKRVTSRVLEAKLISADPFLARRLQIQLGAEVVFLYRVRMMDSEPAAIERSYLPHALCPGILAYNFAEASLYEVLSTVYDRSPDHAEQVIEASLATPEVALLLDLEQPAVVLVFHRETRLSSGQVIEYVDSELRGDRFRFFTDLQLQTTPDEFAFRRLPVPIETESRG